MSMMKFRTLIAVAGAVGALAFVSPAMADPVGNIDTWQLTGGSASSDNCPTVGTFGKDCGSVAADQVSTSQVQITVYLSPVPPNGHTVFASTGAGPTFAFTLS